MILCQPRVCAQISSLPIGLFLCLFALFCSGVSPAVANPSAESGVFTHVQVTDPQFCSENGITSCWMIDQYASENGTMDFALFFQPWLLIGASIHQLRADINWPAGWQYVGTEACLGEIETVLGDDGVSLICTFPEGAALADNFFLIGKITLSVAERGYFNIYEMDYNTYDDEWFWCIGVDARAGYDCPGCSYSCDDEDQCTPYFDQSDLNLTAIEGETAVAEFHGSSAGDSYCDIYFTTEFDWIELEAEETGDASYDVTVTANAADLAPGLYEGWITGTTPSCSVCRYVIFEVLSLSPIEETSWGQIKTDYR
jgi:hypothetical protein